MESLSEKIYIELEPPTEEDARSDQRRLLDGLKERYGEVELPLPLLRQLYPLCRKAEWHLTVTLVWDGTRWQVTGLEPGDTTAWHYGLAADLGSTSVTMELVDLDVYKRQVPGRREYCPESTSAWDQKSKRPLPDRFFDGWYRRGRMLSAGRSRRWSGGTARQ